MSGIGDVTMAAIEYTLGGLAQRADVRANNMANSNTPGFQASTVSFESALESALSRGDVTEAAAPQVVGAPGTPDAQGNTVQIENEMVEGMKDNLAYEAMISSYNAKLGIIRTAIGGQV
jgi:flagellar basal-body rod protein FlgB